VVVDGLVLLHFADVDFVGDHKLGEKYVQQLLRLEGVSTGGLHQ